MCDLVTEVNRSHIEAVADLFVNKAVKGRDISLIITDISNLMGAEHCAHSVSLGLQKSGLKNSMFAGNVAMKLTGIKDIGYIEYKEPEKEEVENQK
ncbi:MAG: hypothetical protein C0625_16955 [Arcobacter sp.]|nr:MAG: hypothetical protein C0625_16955 [Arcobacter sp.]